MRKKGVRLMLKGAAKPTQLWAMSLRDPKIMYVLFSALEAVFAALHKHVCTLKSPHVFAWSSQARA